MLLSLVMGYSGLQATIAGLWLHRAETESEQAAASEEETLTAYDSQEIIDSNETRRSGQRDPRMVGWEFKILRADSDIFHNPATLQAACDEESLAGWILLEKLDDRRLRFKRPIAMREVINPQTLEFDPYRSFYGRSHRWKQQLMLAIGILALLLPAYFSFQLVSQRAGNADRISQPRRR
ncbi:hypothetical protein IQ266_23470 [filamentous cyanobacterium LEGE 11480]|uniref:Uncharacterized protein n=1 Tax=Romeriopsis navalis LEGE 11480 TaxID=2777977 RepID=A0A928Z4J8_9CYAN|nr:hypothetical protein [Romeriopsis navalis]MBE9032701.1 hypothetical protein [Romeriopsis navalis LEGE 11480]